MGRFQHKTTADLGIAATHDPSATSLAQSPSSRPESEGTFKTVKSGGFSHQKKLCRGFLSMNLFCGQSETTLGMIYQKKYLLDYP